MKHDNSIISRVYFDLIYDGHSLVFAGVQRPDKNFDILFLPCGLYDSADAGTMRNCAAISCTCLTRLLDTPEASCKLGAHERTLCETDRYRAAVRRGWL